MDKKQAGAAAALAYVQECLEDAVGEMFALAPKGPGDLTFRPGEVFAGLLRLTS